MAAPIRRSAQGSDLRSGGRRDPATGPMRGILGSDGRSHAEAATDPRSAKMLDLQRDAGNRAVLELLGDKHGAGPGGAVAVQRKPSRKDQRRRARASRLNAADARRLLGEKLPYALARMSESQVDQIQKVFDASVVNPEVRAEAAAIDKKSVIAESGGYANRDPDLVEKAERVREQGLVPVDESDKRVRLDALALLAPDALTPRTDNPDEGAYLARVKATFESRGVYLRVAGKLVRDPEDPSRHIIDPRQFEAWLSLGPAGDAIPTQDGKITRDAIIGTTVLGAGYYEHVDQGPIQRAIDREVKRLRDAIQDGMAQHTILRKIRDDAFVGVAEISDLLGGADFPSFSAWDQPHKLLMRAMEFNVGGNVSGAQAFLVVAAVVTRNAARQLSDYIDDTSSGAERAVAVLKVAKRAGEVAEVGLALTGVGGLVKGGMRLAAGEAVAADAVDVAADRLVKRYAAQNGISADELASVRYVRQPPGSIAGGVKPGSSSGAGTGWHKW